MDVRLLAGRSWPGEPLVLSAGAVPLDAGGDLVGPGDPVAQTRQVLDNLGQALEEAAGVGWEDVLKTTMYVVAADRKDLADVWAAVQESPVSRRERVGGTGISTLGFQLPPGNISGCGSVFAGKT